MTVAKLNPAGCCSAFVKTNTTVINQVKITVLDTLKKAAFFTTRFFMQAGHYLSQGAVVLKGAMVEGFKNMKTFTAQHPKELKIAAVVLGVGIALTALVSHLYHHHAAPISHAHCHAH
jgi:hypothetical protein